ncbi:hypothetical protein ACFVRD_44325 [Streptomyces sp. NPDC057908]|uniref:hypothetical protein n=1 Tax=Streptomyces sp. NPDC057908 TaxID=3346276 RepID=UPI0036E0026E
MASSNLDEHIDDIEVQPTASVKARFSWKAAGIAVVCALFAAQSVALVVVHQQISDLQRRAAVPSPAGPAGPQGPMGPIGPQGPRGLEGPRGDAAPPAVDTVDPLANSPTDAMTQTEARAHCTTQSTQAWPDSTDTDPTLKQLGDAYSATMRDKAFRQCMEDEGYPHP